MKTIKTIKFFALSILLFVSLASITLGQTLPAGEWRLVSYNFKDKVAYPISGMDITLNVHDNGKLGGKDGCNVYGGSYTLEDGKLKIADIISTMMACEEPTPQFEQDYMGTLTGATEFKLDKGDLTIIDAKTKSFLRFEPVKPSDVKPTK